MRQVHITRHPVLNTAGELFGYELQVRQSYGEEQAPQSTAAASASALVDAINRPGFGHLLGDKPVFISVDQEFVQRGFTALLPARNVILELLQAVDADLGLLERLQARQQEGFGLSLNVLSGDPAYAAVFQQADFLKLDLAPFDDGASLVALFRELRQYPARLIADNVHTRQAFEACRRLGFDLFQGQYFAKPAAVTTESLPPQKATLVRLLRLLSQDAEFPAIEALFKEAPELSYKLLKLINSAAFYHGERIHSIRQALVLLGQRNLMRWVSLLLYAGEEAASTRNPLLEEAVVRGRIMELAMNKISGSPEQADTAFFAGTLSVIQGLVGRPLEQIVTELNLDTPVAEALLERKGTLGTLLDVTERLREQRTLSSTQPTGRHELSDQDLYFYEEQATLEVQDLDGEVGGEAPAGRTGHRLTP
jgi:EAL and modified HD-GYP domain-containing signal transduction protein